MQLRLNGQPIETLCLTIRELLLDRGIDPEQRGIAVAINDEVILRAMWGEHPLDDGDDVELITAMQGG